MLIFFVAGPVVEMKGDEMTRYGKIMDKRKSSQAFILFSKNVKWKFKLALYFCKGSTFTKPIFCTNGRSKNKFLGGVYR